MVADLPPSEQIHVSAVRFLLDGHEEDAASVLLACSLDVYLSGDTWYRGDEVIYAVHVHATAPRPAFEVLLDTKHPITIAILRAIDAVLPENVYRKHFTVRAQLVDIDADWRRELLEIARGRGIHNQAVESARALIWNNLRFRSKSEIRIAQALDRAGVLFLPNCKVRLGPQGQRRNREADFLVCCDGKWGILEVDGEPFHPATRTVEDHERDRLFRSHGILVVEHFDASECYNDPDGVVRRFLDILRRA